ncbi:BhlA/UviB family holin-like peptide [Brevibacillus laterosporus]|nr:BhlA/UviB family holin-like peptide [Brevibacillus laterosporus]MDN9011214.1 BhlA/UviB family holin-like peptide [Brevibacillus laterosporus]MDO0942237.1 BhlA/UviB family holin-like peptide [Brevibacillus laterosporus]
MEESVMNALLQQGPFAALFVWLLFSIKKRGKRARDSTSKTGSRA